MSPSSPDTLTVTLKEAFDSFFEDVELLGRAFAKNDVDLLKAAAASVSQRSVSFRVRLLAALPSAPDHHEHEVEGETLTADGPVFRDRVLSALARSPSAPDHRLREAAQAVLDAVEPRPTGSPGMTLTPTVRYNAESIIALRAVLSEATPDPALDVERRLYVLAKLVGIAHDEMPERLNNRTRVNVNHAAAVADPLRGHSCGECNDLLADYDRQSTCVYCSGPDRAGLCFGGDKCMRLAASQPPEPDIQ